MVRKIINLFSVVLILIIAGCTLFEPSSDHKLYKNTVSRYAERSEQFKEGYPNRKTFSESGLNVDDRDLLKFLYASMPLSDIADYSYDFHLANVRMATLARREMVWGKIIPDELFLHFVLPIRVNNENLDSFRLKYYDEIRERIKGISTISEAALEINRWCHEKATYKNSDIRTSSPLATILSASGRCGEESTFTVAALRTAGIPARQVYTPRWAHTDDNHAWVEIWNKGEWKYLGACEPEPMLDMGWFTEPARRAMLVHTKTFGAYFGSEKTVFRNDQFAEINNLAKYAETKEVTVKVSNNDGSPASGTSVEFQLYNYAELYPLATLPANSSGYASFTTGLGDLVIWAIDGDRYIFQKISVIDFDTLFLILPDGKGSVGRYEFDLIAPEKRDPYPDISNDQVYINRQRLKSEDSIRQRYVNSWIDREGMTEFAIKNGYSPDFTSKVLGRSMGNYKEIMKFLRKWAVDKNDLAMKLLSEASDKDLRDTPSEVFEDHLLGVSNVYCDNYPSEMFTAYILNPRIADELITPWRLFLQLYFSKQQSDFMDDPTNIYAWITENITITDRENYFDVPISPKGVLNLRYSDATSADILFVAVCRSFGIAARLEPGTLIPQYFQNSEWYYADKNNRVVEKDSFVNIKFSYNRELNMPEYYKHFTLARLEDGRFNTLDYPYNASISEFSSGLELEPGKYMLVTGNRINENKVLASVDIFEIAPGEFKIIDVRIMTEEGNKNPIIRYP